MDRVGEHINADWLHQDDMKIVMGITYGTIPFLFHNVSLKVKAFLHLDFTTVLQTKRVHFVILVKPHTTTMDMVQ